MTLRMCGSNYIMQQPKQQANHCHFKEKKKNFRLELKNYYSHTRSSIMFTVFVVMYCIIVIEQNKTFYTQIHMLFNDFFF